jgi:hypothetical protein
MAKQSKTVTKTTNRPARAGSKRQDEFYEFMPGAYLDSYELFPSSQQEEEQDEQEAVRYRMLRQLLILLALLVVQFILFAILLRSTANLG